MTVSPIASGPPKAVVFDCDGVLVDSERLSNVVFAEVVSAEGLPTTFDESVARYMGRSTAECVAEIEAALGRPLRTDLVGEYEQRAGQLLRRDLTPVDGIIALLDSLVAKGIPRCVASSGTPPEIALRLAVTGLGGYFGDDVYSASMVARGKPEPDLFLFAAERLGVDSRDCVLVEDSPYGVTGGKLAGMTVIGYAGLLPAHRLRDAGADVVVDSMFDAAKALRL